MCRLARVVLDNFLSFGHLDFDLCGRDGPLSYALIYGENGSGKTNLVQSVRFLYDSVGTIVRSESMDYILASLGSNDVLKLPEDVEGRRLESLMLMGRSYRMTGTEEPMSLRYEFDTDACRLSYAMTISSDGSLVREEMSRFTTGSRTSRLFLVESTDEGPDVRFGRGVFGPEISRKLRRRIPESWGGDSLLAILMSEFSRNGYAFMESSISEPMMSAMGFVSGLSTYVGGDPRKVAWPDGTPVEGGAIEPEEKPFLDAYGRAASSYLVRLCSDIKGAEYETWDIGGLLEYRLAVDRVVAGERRRIPIEQESAGTRKLLRMLPALLRCVQGGVALIDGFDSGIHDRMVRDMLEDVVERTQIEKDGDNARFTLDGGTTWTPLPGSTLVSMNFWGFTPVLFPEIERQFVDFYHANSNNPKAEIYIPKVVDNMIHAGEVKVKVLRTDAKWFGVTYKEDTDLVNNALAKFDAEGLYTDMGK